MLQIPPPSSTGKRSCSIVLALSLSLSLYWRVHSVLAMSNRQEGTDVIYELVLVSSPRDIQNTKRLRNWQKEGQIHTLATHKGIKCIAMDGLKSQANQLLKDKESLSLAQDPSSGESLLGYKTLNSYPQERNLHKSGDFSCEKSKSQSQLRKI